MALELMEGNSLLASLGSNWSGVDDVLNNPDFQWAIQTIDAVRSGGVMDRAAMAAGAVTSQVPTSSFSSSSLRGGCPF